MTRRLVLLRHGRTAWNAETRGQGHADIELDDTGHAQAADAAVWVAGLEPTLLWSSDLARARQTTAYLAKQTGLDPVYDARLREFDLGERTGLTIAEFAERYPDEHAAFAAGRHEAVPGGESTGQVAGRFEAVLGDLLRELTPDATAVVVSHGAALKVGLIALLGWSQDQADGLAGLRNCRAAVLAELPTGRFRLEGYGLGPAGPDFVSAPGVG